MPVNKHLTSTPWWFVPITGFGDPSIAEAQFTALNTDPVELNYVAVTIINSAHELWDLALNAFFGEFNFGLGQSVPDYFIGARDGPFMSAEFSNTPNDYLLWYRLTIGNARPVDVAPEAYVVYEFA